MSGEAKPEWLPLRSAKFYANQGIEVLTNTRVMAVDPRGKTVTTQSGERLAFDKALLATGAVPRKPAVPGADGEACLWPLITGERAHYELAAGHMREAQRLVHALEAFAGEVGLLPEQIWDAPDIPSRELFFGRPSGSAMPLMWAHAEYIKLLRSLRDGRVFDAPPQAVERYAKGRRGSSIALWRFSLKCRRMPAGKILRIEVPGPVVVRWSIDGRRQTPDLTTRPTGLGGQARHRLQRRDHLIA